MATISNSSSPALGFSQGTKLAEYAGQLDKAKREIGGKVSAKEADSLRLTMSLKGGAKKAVNLARDYVLKGVSAGAFGDRVLGQLGLSIGGQLTLSKTSLLGRGVQSVDGPNYRKYGFPYRKTEPRPKNPVVTQETADYVQTMAVRNDPGAATAQFVDSNENRSTATTYILDKRFEDARDLTNGLPGVLSMVWTFDRGELFDQIQNQMVENVMNSQRRLSLIVFKDYPSDKYEVLTMPYVPMEMNWTPQNTYATIAAFSRNVPDYQYLGSSQEFSFEIDWYSNEGKYEEIVKFAKLVDSYSRSDGYGKNPPLVKLKGLYGYDGYFFYIKSAPYRITEKSGKLGGDESIYPRQIIQTVTLQRVAASNPKWEVYEVQSGDNIKQTNF